MGADHLILDTKGAGNPLATLPNQLTFWDLSYSSHNQAN
jgi:hypothetical protein